MASIQLKRLAGVFLLMILAGCATPDPVSYDGLVLRESSTMGTVYVRPGADLTIWKQVALAPCDVAFRRNWLSLQNSSRRSLAWRVTQQDMDNIREGLSSLCDDAFREALLEAPAYTLIDPELAETETLLVTPRIIDLDIVAPDVARAGMARTYTTQSDEMTLLLEVSDAHTGQVLARVTDRRVELRSPRFEWSNSVTQRRDAKRALSRWAEALREGLDSAAGASAAQS